MSQRVENTQWYSQLFEKFEDRLATSAEDLAYRRNAIKDLTAIGFPGTGDEEWRGTRLSSFFSEKFVPSFGDPSSFEEIQSLLEKRIESHRIVFVDGHLQESLSDLDSLESGLRVSGNIPVSHDASARFRESVSDDDKSFFLLNSALTFSSTNVLISDKSQIEKPIELVFIALGDQVCSHPRISVLAGKQSSATIVERYVSLAQTSHFTNAQVSVQVEEASQLEHVRIQDENHSAYHISSLRVQQDNSSVFRSTCISLGGLLTRNHICTSLNGEGIESILNGLFIIDGNQHVDNHTLVEHKRANSKSFELYKGILFDKSTGVFRGQVLVRREAQKNRCISTK
jgi:Fe-S cluster assembly protein SufD